MVVRFSSDEKTHPPRAPPLKPENVCMRVCARVCVSARVCVCYSGLFMWCSLVVLTEIIDGLNSKLIAYLVAKGYLR